MNKKNKLMSRILVVQIIFLLTTFNLHAYPGNPKSLWEWILALVGVTIWLSPFIVIWISGGFKE